MFWRRWIDSPIPLLGNLACDTGKLLEVRVQVPPEMRTIRVITDSPFLIGRIEQLLPGHPVEEVSGSVIHVTDRDTFRTITTTDSPAIPGTTFCNRAASELTVFGPPNGGNLLTTVRGACHIPPVSLEGCPVHSAVLADGTAIVGAAGAGKTTLSLQWWLRHGTALMTDDWSHWSVSDGVLARSVGDIVVIGESAYSELRSHLDTGVRQAIELQFRSAPTARIDHLLFQPAPTTVQIRRVFLLTPHAESDALEQLARSNYHLPFVFPFGEEAIERECRARSADITPFDAGITALRRFWSHVVDRVRFEVLDRRRSVGELLTRIEAAYLD